MATIKQVLIRRDGMTAAAADDLIDEAREMLQQYLDDGDFISAEDICAEYFGLELDYIDELMPI